MVFLSFTTFNIIAFTHCKFQEEKNIRWWNGYLMCCVNYIFTILISSHINVPTKDTFDIKDLLLFIPYIIIADIVFYLTHRLVHTKYLYGIHKQHHEWINPVSSSFLDAHPIEHLLVNLPTVIIPLYIAKVSNIQQGLWVIGTTINSITGHMASLEGDNPHILHHTLRKVNYGAGGLYLMDRIMGSYKNN